MMRLCENETLEADKKAKEGIIKAQAEELAMLKQQLAKQNIDGNARANRAEKHGNEER